MAKILVIDDEHGIRSLLDTVLSRKGYEVVLAASGPKGLELLRREHPDAVVLGLKMPEMDGATVLKQIRSADQNLPVIVLTGAGTPETERQVHALVVTEYVGKGILAASPRGLLAEASPQDLRCCDIDLSAVTP